MKSEVPSDVYQEVANKALFIAENSKGKYEELVVKLNDQLDGKLFGRKVAKRSVMTLPYGVSKRSSNAYVYEEVDSLLRTVALSGAERKGVRAKMGNLIWEAILLVVEMPVTGKEYFQAVAKEMAEYEMGLLWITPTGLPVTQNLKAKKVKVDGASVVRLLDCEISFDTAVKNHVSVLQKDSKSDAENNRKKSVEAWRSELVRPEDNPNDDRPDTYFKSFEIAVGSGFKGSHAEWMEILKEYKTVEVSRHS